MKAMKILKVIVAVIVALIFINVLAASIGLTWVAPTQREDGTPLNPSEIAGYRIYYGTAPGDYQTQITVNDPYATSFTIGGLAPATYYFVMTTIDTDGRESLYSSEIVMVIQGSGAFPNTVTNIILTIGTTPTRTIDRLQALYKFELGTGTNIIYDVSGVTPVVNLNISDMNSVSWGNSELTVTQPTTIISSLVGATKLNSAISASNEITIEAWVVPANTTQAGPARIVSISVDTANRNFTLGQSTDSYEIRLRTTTTGLNGSSPAVSTPAGSLSVNPTHIVYSRDAAGNVIVYIDNVLVTQNTITGNFSNWDQGYELMLTNEYTNNRPWLGTFKLVAIYSKALTPQEINNNYLVGPNP